MGFEDWCDFKCSGEFVALKIISLISIVISVLMFIFGTLAYEPVTNTSGAFPTIRISDNRFGSWWAGVPLIVCGLVGIFINNRAGLLLGCLLGIVSFCTALAATIIDSLGASCFSTLAACTNSNNSSYSGDPDYFNQAKLCFSFSQAFEPKTGKCYCAAATSCASISHVDSDCAFLLSPYPQIVRNSAIFAGITLLVSAIYLSICFTNAYTKGKEMRRRKRNSDIVLETISKPPTEEKHDLEEEL